MDREQRTEVAGPSAQADGIAEKRLALEFERLKFDRQKAGIELRLKRRELKAPQNKQWRELIANPVTLAIVGGFVTLMTTTIAGHFNAAANIDAETAKTRQALQADLIKKFVDNPNPQIVRANLQFLVDVGLVPSYSESLRSFLQKQPDSALPSSFTPGVTGLRNVRTDDDAIDLVIKLEGGFASSATNPDLTTNFGITLDALSRFLGRTASQDDLRALTVETARQVYKKQYLSGAAAALTSVQVKAAYLGLAVNMGPVRANKLLQAAIGKLNDSTVVEDGILGPATVQRANDADPDLLIETVNCGAAEYYKSLPQFNRFGKAWIRSLRVFSPVTLRGLCAELRDAPNATAGAPSQP